MFEQVLLQLLIICQNLPNFYRHIESQDLIRDSDLSNSLSFYDIIRSASYLSTQVSTVFILKASLLVDVSSLQTTANVAIPMKRLCEKGVNEVLDVSTKIAFIRRSSDGLHVAVMDVGRVVRNGSLDNLKHKICESCLLFEFGGVSSMAIYLVHANRFSKLAMSPQPCDTFILFMS